MLSKQIEEEIVTSPMDPIVTPTNVTLPNELLSTASLKKQEVETKTSKRKKTWYEEKRKCAKKGVTNKEKIQRCVTRKKKNVQRYLTTHISLTIFAKKSVTI
jgi:hypothetical protein